MGSAAIRALNTLTSYSHRKGTRPVHRTEIDPPALYRHPAFKRVVTVQRDMKLVFIAG
jgi:hypothetical protein